MKGTDSDFIASDFDSEGDQTFYAVCVMPEVSYTVFEPLAGHLLTLDLQYCSVAVK